MKYVIFAVLFGIAPCLFAEIIAGTPSLQMSGAGGSITIDAVNGIAVKNLVKKLTVTVSFKDGSSFATAGIKNSETVNGIRRVTFALTGTAAADARVSADVSVFSHAVITKWNIRCEGVKRELKSKQISLGFASPVTGARTTAMTKFVLPTGAEDWEVPGDTPYRDFECQIREMSTADKRLIAVTDWYDPDWIYEGNIARSPNMSIPLTNASPLEGNFTLTFIAPRENDSYSDADYSALAHRRPVSLRIESGVIGNAFNVKTPIRFSLHVRNIDTAAYDASLAWKTFDYYGIKVAGNNERIPLAAGASKEFPVTIHYEKRGILFLTAVLKAGDTERHERTSFSIMPQRTAANIIPTSPFGIASLNADPQKYPEQRDPAESLSLLQRMGVRWLRGGHGLALKTNLAPEALARARTTISNTLARGILPFCELQMPKSDVPDPQFAEKIRTAVGTFASLVPVAYFEFGNEVNLRKDSAEDYVKNVLAPAFAITRKIAPDCKVMTMGFGGVDKKWIDAFTAAGGGKYCDVYAIHPGCHPRTPEYKDGDSSWRFRPQLDMTFAAAAQDGRSVWFTEMYSPTPPGRTQVDLRTSADYLVRTYVLAIARGVKVINWYTFRDGTWFAQRQKSTDIEYSFGIVYADLTPKPQFPAYGAMTEQLEEKKCAGRLDLGAEDLYGVRFAGTETVDVLWSYREKHETDLPWWPKENYLTNHRTPGEPWMERWKEPVTVTLPAAGTVTVTDIMGNSTALESKNGNVSLKLTGSPVYVRGLGTIPLRQQVWLD